MKVIKMPKRSKKNPPLTEAKDGNTKKNEEMFVVRLVCKVNLRLQSNELITYFINELITYFIKL